MEEEKKDLRNHFYHLIEMKNVPFTSIKCGSGREMKIYEPISKIVFPDLFKESKEEEKNEFLEEIFSTLTYEKTIEKMSRYIHSGMIEMEDMKMEELFEMLQFVNELSTFKRLKAKIGKEIEKRLEDENARDLSELVKKMHERSFDKSRNWLLHCFLKKEKQDKEISFSEEIKTQALFAFSDKHLLDLFEDVLNYERNEIDLENAKDGFEFEEILEHLWNEREESGDFMVASENGPKKLMKFHSAVLTFLPFFRNIISQSPNVLVKGESTIVFKPTPKTSQGHITQLSSESFEALMEFVYLSKKSHFDAFHALELLDEQKTVEFYLAEMGEEVSTFLAEKLDPKYINEKNSLRMLLLSLKNEKQLMRQDAISNILKDPHSIDQLPKMKENDQMLIISHLLKSLIKENKDVKECQDVNTRVLCSNEDFSFCKLAVFVLVVFFLSIFLLCVAGGQNKSIRNIKNKMVSLTADNDAFRTKMAQDLGNKMSEIHFLHRENKDLKEKIDRLEWRLTMDSVIVDKGLGLQLKEWYFSNKSAKLIYRGSRDGFKARQFHQKCDHQGPTLTVIKTTKGNIFGGFQTISFNSDITRFHIDFSASIFSLVGPNGIKKFKINPGFFSRVIYNNPEFGPTFGYGHDLHICDNSNLSRKSLSYPNITFNAESYLDGSLYFQVSEIEVFQIA